MQFVISDLIDRARVYVNDDHKEDNGWIADSSWLTFFNVEYAHLYRQWVRGGLVRPKPTDTNFTGGSTTVNGVLAVVGVGEDMGSYVRLLRNAQTSRGPDPFWFGSSPMTGKADEYAVHGGADNLYVEVNPPDTATTYIVRWIPTLTYNTSTADTVDLPYGGDELLVLGMARRALVKESSRSASLEQLRLEVDAEMKFTAAQHGGGFRVRRVQRGLNSFRDRFSTFPTDQRSWLYI